MFKTILFKEIKGHLGTVTFAVWMGVSCLVVWMALESGYSRYEHKHQQYLDQEREAKKSLSKEYFAFWPEEEIFRVLRQPSVLSTIVYGLEGELPVYLSVNPNGVRSGSKGMGGAMSRLLGELDFLLVIEMVFGLMAVVLAATLVSSEGENGTLKLILANPVSRSTVLLGKGLGAFAIIAFVFVFSTFIGLLFLSVKGFPLLEREVLASLLVIVAGSLVYLLCVFLVGMICSILFLNTRVALVLSVLLWAVLSFLLPKSAGTAAELMRPAEDGWTVYLRQKSAREAHLKAHHEEVNKHYPHLGPAPDSRDLDYPGITETAVAAWGKYSDRIAKEVTTIAEDHNRNKQAQEALGKVLSRLSPASSLRLLLANVAGTGDQVKRNFLQAAWNYQNTVDDKVFSKRIHITIRKNQGWPWDMGAERPPPLPPLLPPSLESVLVESALEIALLFVYSVFLFMLAYMLFIRRSIA